jgi:beta-lactamase superfamily II metal-dependent hydrolase
MTHHDEDHYNLFGFVLDKTPIRNCYYSGDVNGYNVKSYQDWVWGIENKRTKQTMGPRVLPLMTSVTVNNVAIAPISIIEEVMDNGTIFNLKIIASNVVAPDSELDSVKTNTKSIIIQGTLTSNETVISSFLLCGDATRFTETFLCATYAGRLLDANVVKVPHHGAENSSTPEFVNATRPGEAVFSCIATNKKFAHPKHSVVELWRAETGLTDDQHSITDWELDNGVMTQFKEDAETKAVWSTYDNGTIEYTFTEIGEVIRNKWAADVNGGTPMVDD